MNLINFKNRHLNRQQRRTWAKGYLGIFYLLFAMPSIFVAIRNENSNLFKLFAGIGAIFYLYILVCYLSEEKGSEEINKLDREDVRDEEDFQKARLLTTHMNKISVTLLRRKFGFGEQRAIEVFRMLKKRRVIDSEGHPI